jgi:hypothetical protein
MARTASRATKKAAQPATRRGKASKTPEVPPAPAPVEIPPTKRGANKPLQVLAPYLGKRPDEWFAERIGRSIQTVAAMRLQAGMPSYGERCRARLPITVPDAEIERAIAQFRGARKKYRHRGPTPGGW